MCLCGLSVFFTLVFVHFICFCLKNDIVGEILDWLACFLASLNILLIGRVFVYASKYVHFPGAIKVEVKRHFKFLILFYPHSGKGHAHALFYGNVQRMLQEAGMQHTLIITGEEKPLFQSTFICIYIY